jgi:hypothetical protein
MIDDRLTGLLYICPGQGGDPWQVKEDSRHREHVLGSCSGVPDCCIQSLTLRTHKMLCQSPGRTRWLLFIFSFLKSCVFGP